MGGYRLLETPTSNEAPKSHALNDLLKTITVGRTGGHMSLNPSCNHVEGSGFPTLGDPPFSEEHIEIIKAELRAVIPDVEFDDLSKKVVARAHGWEFRRCWYYWACTSTTQPMPFKAAKKLNKTWGGQVRVYGFGGGTDPKGDVSVYHIDTPKGLRAFVQCIAEEGCTSLRKHLELNLKQSENLPMSADACTMK